VAFSSDSRQWEGTNPVQFGVPRTGAFEISGLRAGEYYVAALDSSTFVNQYSRRLLEELSKTAERVTLLENDQRSIDLAVRK
jgi:hypothetical protein